MTLLHEDITEAIISAAIEVHRYLGPGLLESAYEACVAHELLSRGLAVSQQVALPVEYKGHRIDAGYRLDMVVARSVVVEVKAVDGLAAIHEAQLLTYLRLSGLRVGLLINFNVKLLRDGVKRRVL